jgi:hypothetical protein
LPKQLFRTVFDQYTIVKITCLSADRLIGTKHFPDHNSFQNIMLEKTELLFIFLAQALQYDSMKEQ